MGNLGVHRLDSMGEAMLNSGSGLQLRKQGMLGTENIGKSWEVHMLDGSFPWQCGLLIVMGVRQKTRQSSVLRNSTLSLQFAPLKS